MSHVCTPAAAAGCTCEASLSAHNMAVAVLCACQRLTIAGRLGGVGCCGGRQAALALSSKQFFSSLQLLVILYT